MKRSTRRGLIYFRYIFPFIALIGMIILMFIPCYRFITADTGMNAAISLSELMGNSWDTVRGHLFGGTAEQSEATVDFSKYVLTLIIAFVVLFTIGVASVVYSAASALAYFNGGKSSRAHALFITLVPNRVALCVYHALLLPVFFFPMILPVIYGGILTYQVELVCDPFDMLFIALALYLLTVFFVFFTSRYETLEQMNVFYRPRPLKTHRASISEEEDAEDEEELDEYQKMDKRAREEQTERILRLLNKSNDTEEEEDK